MPPYNNCVAKLFSLLNNPSSRVKPAGCHNSQPTGSEMWERDANTSTLYVRKGKLWNSGLCLTLLRFCELLIDNNDAF